MKELQEQLPAACISCMQCVLSGGKLLQLIYVLVLSEVRRQNMKLKEPSVDGGCTTENEVVFANQHQVSHLQEFHMMSPWSCNQYDPLLDIKESGEKAMASMTVQPS